MVHADVGGPVKPTSREGYRYWLMLVDDFTGKPWTYFAKTKDEIGALLRTWKEEAEKYLREKLGNLTLSENWLELFRSDNGTEFTNELTSAWLTDLGIRHERSAPYTPEQNRKQLLEIYRTTIHLSTA